MTSRLSETLSETSQWLASAEQIEKGLLASQPKGRRRASPGGGAGGARHKYVQLLVSQLALNLGYGAIVEDLIPGTRKRVDVSIRGRNVRVACEIPVTTVLQENGNIRKCLDAGYDYVVSVALDRASLQTVEERVSPILRPDEIGRVKFFFPEELSQFLESLEEAPASPAMIGNAGRPVRGYKVTIRHADLPQDEIARRRRHICHIIAQSLVRERQNAAG